MSQTRSKSATPTPERRANPAIIAGAVVAVLLVAAIAVFATSGSGSDDDVTASGDDVTASELDTQYGIVTVTGTPLTPLEDPADDAAQGAPAPTVVSERASATDTLAPATTGRPSMIVFLAHWCPHCQAEVPSLVEMAATGAFDGVDTVAVLTSTTPSRDNFPPSAWLDAEGWTGDRLFDDEQGTAGAAYGLTGFPMLVFTDADGNVVERLSGQQSPEVIEAAIARAEG